ncbi:MAG: tRNA uridine-5-carboxymethylaminomethyl(34) synthesis GTPase MnmE, partial [Bacteroidaceae bacterium]|nr:tRNA uridine-5-carboxymethylaminomethyl(34) synthesis GTPase MnmE [Bacteroidaceae bacterium]
VGIDQLRQQLLDATPKTNESDIIITNARHYDALQRAHRALLQVVDGLQKQLSSDLIAEDLGQVINTLAEITGGQITSQETLNNIFKNFCIGK